MRYCNRWLAIYLAYFAIRSHTAHTMARGGGEEVELLLVFLEAGGERKRVCKEEAEKKVWINKFLLYAYRIQWQINSIFYTYENLFFSHFSWCFCRVLSLLFEKKSQQDERWNIYGRNVEIVEIENSSRTNVESHGSGSMVCGGREDEARNWMRKMILNLSCEREREWDWLHTRCSCRK